MWLSKRPFGCPTHPIIAPRERAWPFHLGVKVLFVLFCQEDVRHRALSLLFIVSHVVKSFTKLPGHCRLHRQVPEEVIMIGMSTSKALKHGQQSDSRGGQDTIWGRNINWTVLIRNRSALC